MSVTPTRVYITSCETGPDAWTHQAFMLREQFPKHDPSLQYVEDAATADVILITDLRDRGDDYRNLRHHPLVRTYPNKCFSVTDVDEPPRWVHGIHTSSTKSLINLNRFRSGSYFLTHPDFKNPYIEEFAQMPEHERPARRFLFSFLGRACNSLRSRILQRKYTRLDVWIRDTSRFNAFTHDPFGKSSDQRRYAEVLASSKFALCPRGAGAASIRLFEAMSLGVAPVIVSDTWLLPPGPDWKSFAIFVDENDDANIEAILTQHEHEWKERGERAREAYHRYFTGEAYVRYLVTCALELRDGAVVPERLVQRLWLPALFVLKVQRRLNRLRRRRDGQEVLEANEPAHVR